MNAAYRNSSRKLSLPNQDHDAHIDWPILALDFITTLDCTLSARERARHGAVFNCTLTGSPPDSPPSSLANTASPSPEHCREPPIGLLAHRAVDPPPSSSLAEERTPLLAPPPCGGARFPTLAARQSAKRAARHSAVHATDSVSRSRDEITVETPSPRMLIPYKASAISIVRFWCVITSNWLVARSSS